jgi:hypothetical protein
MEAGTPLDQPRTGWGKEVSNMQPSIVWHVQIDQVMLVFTLIALIIVTGKKR